MRTVRVTSLLHAPPDTVWRAVRTLRGVNRELAPWLRMTAPSGSADLPFDEVGPVHATSVLLVFGLLPFDVHRLGLESVTTNVGFQERSSSWLQRSWHHDRTLAPHPEGCLLTDEVRFEPRLPVGAVVGPVLAALFAWRHRRLRARWGGRSSV